MVDREERKGKTMGNNAELLGVMALGNNCIVNDWMYTGLKAVDGCYYQHKLAWTIKSVTVIFLCLLVPLW